MFSHLWGPKATPAREASVLSTGPRRRAASSHFKRVSLVQQSTQTGHLQSIHIFAKYPRFTSAKYNLRSLLPVIILITREYLILRLFDFCHNKNKTTFRVLPTFWRKYWSYISSIQNDQAPSQWIQALYTHFNIPKNKIKNYALWGINLVQLGQFWPLLKWNVQFSLYGRILACV